MLIKITFYFGDARFLPPQNLCILAPKAPLRKLGPVSQKWIKIVQRGGPFGSTEGRILEGGRQTPKIRYILWGVFMGFRLWGVFLYRHRLTSSFCITMSWGGEVIIRSCGGADLANFYRNLCHSYWLRLGWSSIVISLCSFPFRL